MRQFDLFGQHEDLQPKPKEPAKPQAKPQLAQNLLLIDRARPYTIIKESKTLTWILHEDNWIVHHAQG